MGLEGAHDLAADGLVEVLGKHAGQAVDEDGVHSDLAELLGQLGADVAGADDRDLLGRLGALLDLLAMAPVLGEDHLAGLEALGEPLDGRLDGLGAGGDVELVEGAGAFLARLEVVGLEGLAGNVDARDVGAHVHVGTRLGKGLGAGVEHAGRVAHVAAHPQGDAA